MFIIKAVNYFFQIVIWMILAGAIMSWFVRAPYGRAYQIYMLLNQLTEPILAPCRKLLYRFGLGGTIDLSPIVAIIGLQIISSVIIRILAMVIL